MKARDPKFGNATRLERLEPTVPGVFAVRSVVFMPKPLVSPTLALQGQQTAADHEEVRQRGGGLEAVQVLRQSPVADLLEAEDPLDHPDRVFDLRANTRLVANLGFDALVDPLAATVSAVGAVAGARGDRADDIGMPLVGLIAPDAGLFAAQQMRQSQSVGDIGSRDQHGMDELVAAVDGDVRLHAEIPLLSLGRLVHLRIALAILVLRRARSTDDRGIHDRAVAHLDAVTGEVPVHRRKQLLAELVLLEQVAELADRMSRCQSRRNITQGEYLADRQAAASVSYVPVARSTRTALAIGSARTSRPSRLSWIRRYLARSCREREMFG